MQQIIWEEMEIYQLKIYEMRYYSFFLSVTVVFLYKWKRDVNIECSWMLLSMTTLAHQSWPISGVIASFNALKLSSKIRRLLHHC